MEIRLFNTIRRFRSRLYYRISSNLLESTSCTNLHLSLYITANTNRQAWHLKPVTPLPQNNPRSVHPKTGSVFGTVHVTHTVDKQNACINYYYWRKKRYMFPDTMSCLMTLTQVTLALFKIFELPCYWCLWCKAIGREQHMRCCRGVWISCFYWQVYFSNGIYIYLFIYLVS